MSIRSNLNCYDNFVLENQLKHLLQTKFDVSRLFVPDDKLTIEPGMLVKVHKYRPFGVAQKLQKGEGNDNLIESSYIEELYRVGCTQSRGLVNDEDSLTDPAIVESVLQGISESMVDSLNNDTINELKKMEQKIPFDPTQTGANYLFGKIAKAVATIKKGLDNFGDQQQISIYISPNMEEYFRNQMLDNLKYTEMFMRTGAVGGVCGVPVYVDPIFPDNCIIIEDPRAVKNFNKRSVEMEQRREQNERATYFFARYYNVIALVENAKCCALCPELDASTLATEAKKTDTTLTITGGDTHATKIGVMIGDDKYEANATSTPGVFETIELNTALVEGDKIKVMQYCGDDFYAPKGTEFTVA